MQLFQKSLIIFRGYKREHSEEDVDFQQFINSDSEDDSLIETTETMRNPLESTANDVVDCSSSVTLDVVGADSPKTDFTEKVRNVAASGCNYKDSLQTTESTADDSILHFSDFADESSVSMNSEIIEQIMDEKVQNDVKLTLNEIVLCVCNEVDKGKKVLTRKRTTNTANWARNVRKLAH